MNVTSPLSATGDSELLVALKPDDFIKESLDSGYDSAQYGAVDSALEDVSGYLGRKGAVEPLV